MSEQDSQKPSNFDYGEDPNMKEMAIEATVTALRATFERDEKPIPPEEELRALAEQQHAASLKSRPYTGMLG